jgi:hypothetical protein
MPPTRRRFLSAALVGLTAKAERRIEGGFVLDSFAQGHRIRDGAARAPATRFEKHAVVIVGGGMAGLSAAWQLERKGFRDFVVLEMESSAGGNSRWGENEVSRYPWAAHYVPAPNRESKLVRELFLELGLMDAEGRLAERHLCHSPQERLFLHGRWQEGLEPEIAASAADRRQYAAFAARMAELRQSRQFTIPMALGARPSPLDSLSMEQWLEREGFTSPYLRWYVDYSCRDDFGSGSRDTSAWAGIHYFASREHEEQGPLTWPEGNGWILERLAAKLRPHLRNGAAVHRIEKRGSGFAVQAGDCEYRAEAVIFAAPEFVLPYVMEGMPPSRVRYSPWIVANLTLDRWPREKGLEPAWDNVIYGSRSLGYVVATHQSLRSQVPRTVWTYYWALAEGPPEANRRVLLERDWGYWRHAILADLERAHPDIRQCVSRLDIFRMGHAMARPEPGFLSRVLAPRAKQGLILANSDQSGFSIFEEAQYRGVMAAEAALRRI